MFKRRLRELRLAKDLTQEALGKMLGVGKTTISQYESGARSPDIEMLGRIADFFGVTIDYLVGRTDNPDRSSTGAALLYNKYPWLRRVPADLLPDTVEAVKEGFVDGMFMRKEAGVTLDNLSDEGLRLFVEALVDYKRKNDEEKRRRGLLPKGENSE